MKILLFVTCWMLIGFIWQLLHVFLIDGGNVSIKEYYIHASKICAETIYKIEVAQEEVEDIFEGRGLWLWCFVLDCAIWPISILLTAGMFIAFFISEIRG